MAVDGPLSDQDRAEIVAGLRDAYRASRRRWHRRVIWVESPEHLRRYRHRSSRSAKLTAGERIRARCRYALSLSLSALLLYLVFIPLGAGVYIVCRMDDRPAGMIGASIAELSLPKALGIYSFFALFVYLCCALHAIDGEGGLDLLDLGDDRVRLRALKPESPRFDPLLPMLRISSALFQGGDIADLRGCLHFGVPGRAFACATFRGLVIVVEPPSVMHTEALPDGTTRPHADDVAALRWPNGEEHFFLHGTLVPKELFDGEWNIQQIERTRNSELRRLAIERMGWERFISRAGLEPLAETEDPGNPGAVLRLYDIPGADARLLVMRNGSPDRSGAHRDYAEPVPGHLDDPVEAAAWQYGCPVDVYRRLERRT
ncbi:DUF6745 domain-containing protein [Actinomadura litoris]|uniref:DUF6745 domain-containing protein n=1 Tax=Actinomadura litoris TaxID=2678616 RepID=A0A7K1KTQ3_9ACTN|nr:hypothetical protein [Actinomadura litoris]MUN35523.1 hypothetical protein [Actinomadura litoris]